MNLLIRKCSFLLFLFFSSQLQAAYIDVAKLQFAGEIGTLAFGVGKQFTKIYSLDFFYGRVPESIGGIEINTFALKNNFNLFKFDFKNRPIRFYTGLGVYHVTGRRYKSSTRSEFPDGYYRIGSIRGLLYIGESISFGKKLKHRAYFESGLNDITLVNFINNSDSVDLFKNISLALGYSYYF